MAMKGLSLANIQIAMAENNEKMKQWVAAQVGNITMFDIQWVDTLPTKDISSTTIYMIKNEDESVDENNIYTEYVYKEDSGSWEILGRVEAGAVDLTGFYTKVEVDEMLAHFYSKVEIDAMLTSVYKKTEVDTMFTGVYKKNEVYAKDEVYAKNEVYTKNDTYAKSEVYSKTEADELLGALEVEEYTAQEMTNMVTQIWSE
jgi:hypothetical protein